MAELAEADRAGCSTVDGFVIADGFPTSLNATPLTNGRGVYPRREPFGN
jgi:hypothetical protein